MPKRPKDYVRVGVLHDEKTERSLAVVWLPTSQIQVGKSFSMVEFTESQAFRVVEELVEVLRSFQRTDLKRGES